MPLYNIIQFDISFELGRRHAGLHPELVAMVGPDILVIAAFAYLAGSIPFGLLVTRGRQG